MKKIKALAIIVLAAVIGFSAVSCPTDGNNGKPKTDNENTGIADVYVLDVSTGTDWDWLVVGTDGSSMVFNVDETTGMPTQLWLKPDKDSDDGMTYVFKENGLPDMIVANGLIMCFDNFNGYTFDFALIYPDGTIEYHFGIETDVNWDAYNAVSVPVGARSAIDTVGTCLNVIGHGIGIITCATAWTNPVSPVGCYIYLGSNIAKSTITILDALGAFDELTTASSNLTVDGINLILDSIGCAGKDLKDCISAVTGLASILIGGDLEVVIDKITQIYEAKEIMKPFPAKVNFHANGGSGIVPVLGSVLPDKDNDSIAKITLPSGSGISRDGYTFAGWSTSHWNDSPVRYSPGHEYIIFGNTSFYAQWNRLVPGVPEGVTTTAESETSITVSWNAVSGATGYYVYGTSSTSSNFSLVATVLAPSTSYTVTGLSENTVYFYKVSYYNDIGESDLSPSVGAKTLGGEGEKEVGIVEMVYVEGGTFQLGKELGTAGRGDVTPVSKVTLSSFYIGKYEVTQSQWYAVMGTTIEEQQAAWAETSSEKNSNYGRGDDFPMYFVNWYEAIVFCNRLSLLEGLTPAYRVGSNPNPDNWLIPFTPTVDGTANGYRLPTEAQWEYAAKGGNPLADGWAGYTYSGSNIVRNVATLSGDSRVVGSKAPNRLGIYDMSGSVDEWCWDWRGDYTSTDKIDPQGPSSGSYRTNRGGGYYSGSSGARSVSRGTAPLPSFRNNTSGFRIARPGD